MNNEKDFITGCSEEFAELCALSTSGELSAEETEGLRQHASGCAPCRALLREYTSLTTIGMAKLAAEDEPTAQVAPGYDEKHTEERFAAALRVERPTRRTKLQSRLHLTAASRSRGSGKRLAFAMAMAASILLCLGGGIEIGSKIAANSDHPAPSFALTNKTAKPDPENARLKAELRAAKGSLDAITARSADLERSLRKLTNTKESLAVQIDHLSRKDNADAALLSSAAQQRDGLQQELKAASASLIQANEELNQARRDRQGALFRMASLETQVTNLNSELASESESTGNDEKFLAADRDIRELMGARQLYIADVFDVKNNGARSKPFGRVFYTKGKSLIFYAFDLEKQPGYRETKAFQAWGKPDGTSAKPISIGVFYMDSEQNRRWVVQSDNPEMLAEINSVFVTVEPHGGSRAPTGKPFLEAYLHTLPPNHP